MDRYFLRRQGFSLIELSIVMGVVAVLAMAVLPIAVRTLEIKAGEKAIAEVAIIQGAAMRFYNERKSWPADLGQLKSAGYLNANWSLLNPWSDPYLISSTAKTLAVSTQVPANMVPMLSARLLQSSVTGTTVTSVIGAGLDDSVAPGVIAAWSGAIADIPAHWSLCDGTNGTPDLRDKFIVGARQDDGGIPKTNITGILNSSGGSISHDHAGVTGPHALTIAEMPRHHHGYMATPWTGSMYDGHSSPLMTQQVSGNTDDTGGDQPHTHPIALDQHLPPYYALAFIMKQP